MLGLELGLASLGGRRSLGFSAELLGPVLGGVPAHHAARVFREEHGIALHAVVHNLEVHTCESVFARFAQWL